MSARGFDAEQGGDRYNNIGHNFAVAAAAAVAAIFVAETVGEGMDQLAGGQHNSYSDHNSVFLVEIQIVDNWPMTRMTNHLFRSVVVAAKSVVASAVAHWRNQYYFAPHYKNEAKH